ncbi:GDSL-type esterase/lipase family protein [Paenibacillus arenilitoris]|uniref:GDSL family lipase n=1 Tax=Paenibacillus arenilitoris TaxID=2772299 RepID=A0A927CR80_9BACL|nr:GDSL-type esterase/lipase family protein [Paenibacillus arenilitoris]MBD2872274.1 GDSL family lipase [Paenibacillus arenilitoris]
MHSKKVRYMTAFAAVICLAWLVGFGWTVKDYLIGSGRGVSLAAPAEQPAPEGQAGKVVALGDSLTRGTGDDEGKGYAGYLADELKEEGFRASMVNLGIKGLTSAGLLEQLGQKEIARQVGQADIVLLTIGGNDLFLGGQTLSDLSAASLAKLEDAFAANLASILETIRSANPAATVYLLGLYDPFRELEDGAETSRAVRSWNARTMETISAYDDMVFVPTYDLFQRNTADYLFTDRFHPNGRGYRLMAGRLAALIAEEGGAP